MLRHAGLVHEIPDEHYGAAHYETKSHHYHKDHHDHDHHVDVEVVETGSPFHHYTHSDGHHADHLDVVHHPVEPHFAHRTAPAHEILAHHHAMQAE